MKVWHCMALWGLVMLFPVSDALAQEASAPQQGEAAPAGDVTPQETAGVAQAAKLRLSSAPDGEVSHLAAAPQALTPQALFERVTARARGMADQAYQPPQKPLPESLANLDYNDYRDIRFRKEKALWRDDRLFEAQFFHPGFLYDAPVETHVLRDGQVDEMAFDRDMFRYEKDTQPLREVVGNIDAEKMGFAGFRLHYPLNTPHYKDEFLVFLGASYFRMVGRGQGYGISARGLAVNTATQGGEEFPAFRAFWLVQPAPDASTITLFALLDSPSVTGAYRFDIEAANNTVIDVDARLFARNDVAKLGVAPLTSMFLHGENSVNHYDDFRPEVHDSDGMLMHTSRGQWIWRPLTNPASLRVTQLRDEQPRGFGLMQRDRDFQSYLDMEADYQHRPSVWIEPLEGDWGSGGVELVQIPVDSEVHDNIVAYWVPDSEFRAGDTRHYRYRLTTLSDGRHEERLGRVIRTRHGWGAVPGESNPPAHSQRRFVVDFRGGEELASLNGTQPVEAKLTVARGKASELQVKKLPDDSWRASFKLAPQGKDTVDMQLQLMLRGKPLTETWSYIWNPDAL